MTDILRIVHIVDDDEAIRQSVGFLLRKAGYAVETYPAGTHFLKSVTRETRGCVLLDVRMPDLDGLEVQARLAQTGITLPVIMLTGHGDVTLAVRAIKAGAIEFLEKPFERSVLLAAIETALAHAARSGREHLAAADAHRPACRPHPARTRRARRHGARPPQQADRLRPRHRHPHRRSPPRQSDGKACRTQLVRRPAHRVLGGVGRSRRTGLSRCFTPLVFYVQTRDCPRVMEGRNEDHPMTDQFIQSHDGIGVSLVDGDPAIRRARQIMLLSERYDVRSYATSAALLADPRSRDFPCLIVDVESVDGSGMETLHAMRASGWRGKAILLYGIVPLPELVHAAERHGDRILDRSTGDATLLTAIAASIDRGWSGWNADG